MRTQKELDFLESHIPTLANSATRKAYLDTLASGLSVTKVIKNKIYEDNRIVPYITKQELQSTDAMFNNLELDDKKKVLINLVDKNKLYVGAHAGVSSF